MTIPEDEPACSDSSSSARHISVPERSTMRHCLTPLDFTVQELDTLFDLAADIEKDPEKYAHACAGRNSICCGCGSCCV